jgi:SMODS and SLOG-associating 2TM effector domain family 5
VNDTGSQATGFQELYRRASITGHARYHASRRLGLHHIFSQWTLAFLVVGQIVIELITALGLRTNFSEQYISFGKVFFGALVLSYSLLLGMGDYAARAVKFHECGLALGRIRRRLYPLVATPGTADEYRELSEAYYDALDKYDNHAQPDYLWARGHYYSSWKAWLESLALQLLQFSHYIISFLLISLWIYFLVKP